MNSKPQNPEEIVHDEKAQLDFSQVDMSYGDYLQLDAILRAKPLSPTTTRCCSSSSTRPANSG
jgi:tryptophan 2,3-dioxygenase